MNIDAERLLPLIELIYDAALQPRQWRAFTDALCPLLNSRNCNFHAVDVTMNRVQFIHTTIPAFLIQLYLKRFHPKNSVFSLAAPLAQPGQVLLSHEVLPPGEFEKLEFYRYMRIIGLPHAMHLTVLREDNIVSGLVLARPKKGGEYTETEVRPLRLLYPHLQRAFRIGQMLAQLQLERELLSQTLNRLPQGAVVVNASGHTIYSGFHLRAPCGGVEQVCNLLAGQVANLPHGQAWSHSLENRYNLEFPDFRKSSIYDRLRYTRRHLHRAPTAFRLRLR